MGSLKVSGSLVWTRHVSRGHALAPARDASGERSDRRSTGGGGGRADVAARAPRRVGSMVGSLEGVCMELDRSFSYSCTAALHGALACRPVRYTADASSRRARVVYTCRLPVTHEVTHPGRRGAEPRPDSRARAAQPARAPGPPRPPPGIPARAPAAARGAAPHVTRHRTSSRRPHPPASRVGHRALRVPQAGGSRAHKQRGAAPLAPIDRPDPVAPLHRSRTPPTPDARGEPSIACV